MSTSRLCPRRFFSNRELLKGRSCTVAKPLSLCERRASHMMTMTIRTPSKAMLKLYASLIFHDLANWKGSDQVHLTG